MSGPTTVGEDRIVTVREDRIVYATKGNKRIAVEEHHQSEVWIEEDGPNGNLIRQTLDCGGDFQEMRVAVHDRYLPDLIRALQERCGDDS